MNAYEIEFLAENEMVQVIPNFDHDKLYLLSGEVGPFQAGVAVSVPLWLAITMKEQNRGRIVPPVWLNIESISAFKTAEYSSEFFAEPPSPHYAVVAKMLLRMAPDDIPKADQVHSLLQDVWDRRQMKFRNSSNIFIKSNNTFAMLNNCTLAEINVYRDVLTRSLETLYELKCKAQELK